MIFFFSFIKSWLFVLTLLILSYCWHFVLSCKSFMLFGKRSYLWSSSSVLDGVFVMLFFIFYLYLYAYLNLDNYKFLIIAMLLLFFLHLFIIRENLKGLFILIRNKIYEIYVFWIVSVSKLKKKIFFFNLEKFNLEKFFFCWSIFDFIAYRHSFTWDQATEYFKNIFTWTAPLSDKLSVGDDWMLFSLFVFIFCYCCWWIGLQLYANLKYGVHFYFNDKFYGNVEPWEKEILLKRKKILKPNYITLSFFMFFALFLNICLSFNISFYLFNETFNFTTEHGASIIFYLVKLILSIIFILWWFLFIVRFNSNKANVLNSEYSCEVMVLYMLLSFLFFLIVSVIDILTFFLILETTSLIITILGAKSMKIYSFHNLKPTEGSLRFFLLNALNSGVILLGISLIYGYCGTLYFWDLGKMCEYILEIRECMPLFARTYDGGKERYYEQVLFELDKKYLWTTSFIWDNTYYFPRLTSNEEDYYDKKIYYNEYMLKFNRFLKYYWTYIKQPHILEPRSNVERNFYLPGYYCRYFDLPQKKFFRFFLISEFLNKESPILNDIIDLPITRDKLAWLGIKDLEINLWDLAEKNKIHWNSDKGIFYGMAYHFFAGNQYLLQNFLINHSLLWLIDNWLFIEMRNTSLANRIDNHCGETLSHFFRNEVAKTEIEYRGKHGDLIDNAYSQSPASYIRNMPKFKYDELVYYYKSEFTRTPSGKLRYSRVQLRDEKMPIIFILGSLFFICTFSFKLTWVPFHEWIIQLYKGCGSLFVCYISTIPKIALWFLFAKIYVIYLPTHWMSNIILFNIGIITILYAIYKFSKITNLLGVLAWSSILTSGFILIYVTYSVYYNAIILLWILFYIIAYTIGILLIFFSLFIHSNVLFIEFNKSYLSIKKKEYDVRRAASKLKDPSRSFDIWSQAFGEFEDYTDEELRAHRAYYAALNQRRLTEVYHYIRRPKIRPTVIEPRPVEIKFNSEPQPDNSQKEEDQCFISEHDHEIKYNIGYLESEIKWAHDTAKKRPLTRIECEDYIDVLLLLKKSKWEILSDILLDPSFVNFKKTILFKRVFVDHSILPIFSQGWYIKLTKPTLNLQDDLSFSAYVAECKKQLSEEDTLILFEFNKNFPQFSNISRLEIINFYYALVNRVNDAIDKGLIDKKKLNYHKFGYDTSLLIDDYLVDLLPEEVMIHILPDLFEKGLASVYRKRNIKDNIDNLDSALLSFQNDNTRFSIENNYRKIFLKEFLGYFHKLDIFNAFVVFNNDDAPVSSHNINHIFKLYDAIEQKYCRDASINLDLETENIIGQIFNKNSKPYEQQVLHLITNSDINVLDEIKDLSEVSGFGILSKMQAIFLSIGCFVCIGLPPFGLFLIKFIFLLIGGAWGLQCTQLFFSLFPMIWTFGIYGQIVRNIWSNRTNPNISTPKNMNNIIIIFLQCLLVVILFMFFLFFGYIISLSFGIFWTRFQ